jgi:hypothetical protein
MLDDDEFKRVSSLFNTGTEGDARERMFAPALREYQSITGFHETNPNVLYDHVFILFGLLVLAPVTTKEIQFRRKALAHFNGLTHQRETQAPPSGAGGLSSALCTTPMPPPISQGCGSSKS